MPRGEAPERKDKEPDTDRESNPDRDRKNARVMQNLRRRVEQKRISEAETSAESERPVSALGTESRRSQTRDARLSSSLGQKHSKNTERKATPTREDDERKHEKQSGHKKAEKRQQNYIDHNHSNEDIVTPGTDPDPSPASSTALTPDLAAEYGRYVGATLSRWTLTVLDVVMRFSGWLALEFLRQLARKIMLYVATGLIIYILSAPLRERYPVIGEVAATVWWSLRWLMFWRGKFGGGDSSFSSARGNSGPGPDPGPSSSPTSMAGWATETGTATLAAGVTALESASLLLGPDPSVLAYLVDEIVSKVPITAASSSALREISSLLADVAPNTAAYANWHSGFDAQFHLDLSREGHRLLQFLKKLDRHPVSAVIQAHQERGSLVRMGEWLRCSVWPWCEDMTEPAVAEAKDLVGNYVSICQDALETRRRWRETLKNEGMAILTKQINDHVCGAGRLARKEHASAVKEATKSKNKKNKNDKKEDDDDDGRKEQEMGHRLRIQELHLLQATSLGLCDGYDASTRKLQELHKKFVREEKRLEELKAEALRLQSQTTSSKMRKAVARDLEEQIRVLARQHLESLDKGYCQ